MKKLALTWDKVDLLNYRITTKTAKTGKKIAVPIFDYDPASEDYHETLGELRREFETAILERKVGDASPHNAPPRPVHPASPSAETAVSPSGCAASSGRTTSRPRL